MNKIISSKVEFFNKEEINYFHKCAGKKYISNSKNKIIGQILRNTIYRKIIILAEALGGNKFDVKKDNQWQISGIYKKYSWARIYRTGEKDKNIFFTVSLNGADKNIKYKLDCQRKNFGSKKSLTKIQVAKFDQLVLSTDAAMNVISIDDIKKYNWDKLIREIEKFIIKYTPLYDKAVKYVWDNKIINIPQPINSLELTEIPNGKYKDIPDSKFNFGENETDYDLLNNRKTAIGKAGEELVINYEKKFLVSIGRKDLAKKVDKVKDHEGFDILSFKKNGSKKYIEVKTTTSNVHRYFLFTKNEKKTMIEKGNKYYLYRLYNYSKKNNNAKFYIKKGDFSKDVLEDPILFRIYLKRD